MRALAGNFRLGLLLFFWILTPLLFFSGCTVQYDQTQELPSAPRGIFVESSNGQVSIRWDPTPGADFYNITVVSSAGRFVHTDVQSPFTLTGLTNGVTYDIVVAAVNRTGEQGTEVVAIPRSLTPPGGIRAKVDGGQITVSWDSVPGAMLYNLYYYTATTKPTKVEVKQTSYLLQDLDDATNYFFSITAVSGIEESLPSVEVKVTPATLLFPAAEAGNRQIKVRWNMVSGTTYNLYMAQVSGVTKSNYGNLLDGMKHGGVTSPYLHEGLSPGTTYYFVVTAINATGKESAGSREISVTVPADDLTLHAEAGNRIVTLRWNPVLGGDSYNLYMAAVSGVTKSNYNNLSGGMKHEGVTSPYTHTGLANGTAYSFVMTAVGVGGEGVESNEVTATPRDGSFRSTGSMTTSRAQHTATLLLDGRVLIVGGENSPGFPFATLLASAEVYNPADGTFRPTGSMATTRSDHVATLLPDGKVLITGGTSIVNNVDVSLDIAELYDPATGNFSQTAGRMNIRRVDHSATLLANGKVLIAGGFNNVTNQLLLSAEIYDPATATFTLTGNMSLKRGLHTDTLLADGKVLITGGNISPTLVTESADLYSPGTETFFPTNTTMTTSRFEHIAELLPNGDVLIAGGEDASQVTVLNSAELYRNGGFQATGNMTMPRLAPTAVLLPNNMVFIAGGGSDFYDGAPALASAELYDYTTGTFIATPSMVYTRTGHTATLLQNGKVLMTGGEDGFGTLHSSAELYDP